MNQHYFLIDDLPEINEVPIKPLIFNTLYVGYQRVEQKIPNGFNAVTVFLDGRADALLNWKDARLDAVRAVSQGLKIFWKIDLGLFTNLYAPLQDQTQYLTLGLSLEHFCNSLWEEFRQHTLGISLYEGTIDFKTIFKWNNQEEINLQKWLKNHFGDISEFNEKFNTKYQSFSEITSSQLDTELVTQQILSLFCRDTCAEYLNLLAQKLPDGLLPAIFLDTSSIKNELLLAHLLSKDRFEGISRFITDGVLSAHLFSQNEDRGCLSVELSDRKLQTKSSRGICLPLASKQVYLSENFSTSMMHFINEAKNSFRFVHENTLTTDWDGLEHLLVISDLMTPQGIRKLRGFCAAGGTVISVGKLLGLDQEISA